MNELDTRRVDLDIERVPGLVEADMLAADDVSEVVSSSRREAEVLQLERHLVGTARDVLVQQRQGEAAGGSDRL